MKSTASGGVGWSRRLAVTLAIAVLGAVGLAGADDARANAPVALDSLDFEALGLDRSDAQELQGGNCGGPGVPPCPLQAWMRASIAAPLAANNTGALAIGLERAAALQPDPSWASWRTIALQGAAAAKKGDVSGARAACKACHDAWRDAYRRQYRGRIVPR